MARALAVPESAPIITSGAPESSNVLIQSCCGVVSRTSNSATRQRRLRQRDAGSHLRDARTRESYLCGRSFM